MKLLKEEFGVSWLLVFRHKIVYGEPESKNLFNEDLLRESTEENRYSLLGNINNTFKYKGSYEFLLEYPELEGYNRWRQRKNPFFARHDENIGYQKIKTTWNDLGWGGIARSGCEYSILDGTPRDLSNYYFAIGSDDGINYDVVDDVSGFTMPATWDNYFECKNPKSRRFFKIVANGKRLDVDDFHFFIYRLEFYGKFGNIKNSNKCGSVRRCVDHHYFAYWLIIAVINYC